MGKLKVVLSVLALLVVAVGGVTSIGDVMIPQWAAELLVAAGGFLSWLGVTPWVLKPAIAKAFSTASVALSLFVASHAGLWTDGKQHVIVVVVGFAAAVLGLLGRGLPAKPTPGPDAPAP